MTFSPDVGAAAWIKAYYPHLVFALAVASSTFALTHNLLPFVLAGAVLWAGFAVRSPTFAAFSCFVGLILDSIGRLGLSIAGLPLTLSKAAVMGTLVAWLAHAALSRKQWLQITPMTFGMCTIFATMLLSLMGARIPRAAFAEIAGFGMLSVMMHLVVVILPRHQLPRFVRWLSVVFIVVMLVNLYQGRTDPFQEFMFNGWGDRSSGTYLDPNEWCATVLLVCPILMGSLAVDPSRLAKVALLILTVALPLTIFQSLSRSGMLAMLLIAPPVLYMLRSYRKTLLIGAVCVALIIPFVVDIDTWIFRYETLVNPTLEEDHGLRSLGEREALFYAGIEIYKSHPFIGVGVGMFKFHAISATSGLVWKVAHNSYLTVAAEQGTVGIMSHLLFLGAFLAMLWRAFVRGRSRWARSAVLGLMTGFLGFALMAFTLNLATFAIAYFFLGYAVVVCQMAWRESEASAPVPVVVSTPVLVQGTGESIPPLAG